MNKRSHLFVTEKIVKNLPEEKRSWVLHYVEDFYTLAHNFVFEGGLPSHILYERQLEDYLKEEAVFSEKENKPAMSLTATIRYLRENNKKKMNQEC